MGSSSRLARGAPHFAQQRRVDALRLLVAARQQEAGEPLVDVRLLVAVQAARHASPEDPPVDFALHLVAVGQAGGVDAARLLDAEIVARIAEAGAQAEAAQVEPADLVRRTLLAPVGRGQERVGHLPDGGERPTVLAQPHGLFEFRRQLPRARSAISPWARTPPRSAPATPSAPARSPPPRPCAPRAARRACLRSSNCSRQRLSLIFDSHQRFERADFGEPRAQLHRDQPLLGLLAEADHGVAAARACAGRRRPRRTPAPAPSLSSVRVSEL